jgi:hypothetical protein
MDFRTQVNHFKQYQYFQIYGKKRNAEANKFMRNLFKQTS